MYCRNRVMSGTSSTTLSEKSGVMPTCFELWLVADGGGGLLGARDPAGHAKGLELPRSLVEQWLGARSAVGRAGPDVHYGFIVVADRAQRPPALLIENLAGPGEPVRRLVVTAI